ncbi:MAG TPA: tetratricopeptide repeat protein [Bacteroidota bacterium]|nr:tetratricopeptide repeat protein [Bacteroidota bacterium]
MKPTEFQRARMLEQARAFLQEGKALHAAQMYTRMLGDEREDAGLWLELAALYADNGLVRAAVNLLRRALVHLPGDSSLIFHIANYEMRLERYDAALTWYRKLAEKKLPHVHFNMGIAYFYKDNFKYAEEEFRRTLRYDPKFPKIHESLGEVLVKRGAYTEAVDLLRRGIAIDPYSAVSHYLLGLAYEKLDQWQRAYGEFVSAVDLDPNEPSGWQMCAEMLIQLKRYGEAEAYLRKTLELNPYSVESLVDLGIILGLKGEAERAKEFLQKATQVDPAHARAREAHWKARRTFTARVKN